MNTKKMKRIYLVLIIGFGASFCFAQEKVTKVFYYDSDWNRTSTNNNALYLRIITFYENDLNHPIGLVKDYYAESGKLQWEGEFPYYDIENEDNNREEGMSIWYYENGKKMNQCKYDAKGEKYGLVKYWYENGQLEVTYNYHNGKLNGDMSLYNIKGVLQEIVSYKDDVKGLTQKFNENGEIQ